LRGSGVVHLEVLQRVDGPAVPAVDRNRQDVGGDTDDIQKELDEAGSAADD
jgi:hypothetical protein